MIKIKLLEKRIPARSRIFDPCVVAAEDTKFNAPQSNPVNLIDLKPEYCVPLNTRRSVVSAKSKNYTWS